MKAVLYILAILLIAAGAGVAIASFFSPGQVIHGIDAGLAGTLLGTGSVVLGLAGLTNGVEALNQTLARSMRLFETRATLSAETGPAAATIPLGEDFAARFQALSEETPATSAIDEDAARRSADADSLPGGSDRGSDSMLAATAASEGDTLPTSEPEPAIEESLAVQEVSAGPEIAAEQRPEVAEAPREEELYVVEEREFRGKPARVLSDGTVEAETDEGWMRFENMEHLEEYMDAMAAGRA